MPKPLSRAETGVLLDSLRALSDRIAAGEMSAGPTTARIRAIGETVPDELTGDDLVHPDFARGNVLVDQHSQITGVVDWTSAALRDDRAFALVSLRSDLEWRNLYNSSDWAPQPAVDRLETSCAQPSSQPSLTPAWRTGRCTSHTPRSAVARPENPTFGSGSGTPGRP